MPKNKLPVWKYFSVVTNNMKKEVSCIYCNNKYTKNATRLTQHILKCKKCPIEIKKSLDNNFENGKECVFDFPSTSTSSSSMSMSSSSMSSSSMPMSSSSMSLAEFRSNRSNRIDKFLDTTNAVEKKKLDALLARAVYTSGCPLNITENSEWIKFFKALRPAYMPPTRNQLAHSFLDQEHENVKAEVLLKINKASTISLQCDGWSNIRNQAIINFVVTTPEPVIYKTMTTDAERHTGEYIASEMRKVIETIGPSKFFGIVTDNAAAMLKALTIIQRDFDFINVYTCACHTLNLLVGDIMKINSLKTVEASCKEIIKEINGSHVNLATFKKIQLENKNSNSDIISLKLPVKTRWGSILKCIESLVTCKKALQMLMVSDNVTFSKNVRANCLDNDIFWIRLQKLIIVLTPIVKWITLLESDRRRLSQVVVAFGDIELNFDENVPNMFILKSEEKECFSALQKRKTMALKPMHFAANLLDPSFVGEHLKNEEHIAAMEFIHNIVNKHPQFVNNKNKEGFYTDITNYCAKSGLWALDYVWLSVKNVDCVSWQAICKNTQLKDLAVALLSLPTSSAATERSFSTYSFIHNQKRNRLTAQRAGKLMFIAHNKKLLHQKLNIEHNFGEIILKQQEPAPEQLLVVSCSESETDTNEDNMPYEEEDQTSSAPESYSDF